MELRTTSLQVRMTEDEKAMARQLAIDYDCKDGASEMVRLALIYIDVNRPALTVKKLSKKKAPQPIKA